MPRIDAALLARARDLSYPELATELLLPYAKGVFDRDELARVMADLPMTPFTGRTIVTLDALAAKNLVAYLEEEREEAGVLPTDQTLVIQRFRDEIGDWRVVLLSPFGARIHAPWALAAARVIRERRSIEVDAVWSDDGIILRFPDADEAPDPAEVLLDPDDVPALTGLALHEHRTDMNGRAGFRPRLAPGLHTGAELFAAEDNGATPVEVLLTALAGCLTAGIATVATNRGEAGRTALE